VYNGEPYVAEAIESILCQAYSRTEVIVIDDGSEDETPRILESFGSWIRSVRQENRGPSAARNRGVVEASGDFIAFLDADDRWHREKLALQLGHFGRFPACDLCTTHWEYFWVEELAEEARRFSDHPLSGSLAGYMLQTLMLRRETFAEVGPFNVELRYGEDMDWFKRAVAGGKELHTLDEVLVYRRVHPDSLLRSDTEAYRSWFFGFVKEHLDGLRGEASGSGPDSSKEKS
jgi:glycosyltransferase involved in cell wall biosynthesis